MTSASFVILHSSFSSSYYRPMPPSKGNLIRHFSFVIRHSSFFSALCYALHGEGDAVAAQVHFDDADADVLVELDDVGGVADEAGGQLRDVYESVLMDADVDEGPEVGDVGDNTR